MKKQSNLKSTPTLKFHRFSILKVKSLTFIENDNSSKHLNFQIKGHENELLEIRVYINEMKTIESVSCFYGTQFDVEQVGYITRFIINRVKAKFKFKI